MTVAALYVRVSTTAQADAGASLSTQEESCRRHALDHNHVVAEEHVYREVFTGTELWDRPQLTRLREAIRQRSIDVVIAHAIDRLSRDPVHLGVILSEADHKGVAVEFASEALDDSPEGQLIRFVRGYAAKVEHEKIRERSIRGKRARVESGKLLRGAPELYGYRLDRDAGVRHLHEPEARIVRSIFTWYSVDGCSIREIVRRLDDAGVPTPSFGKRTYADGRQPRWSLTSVRNILRNDAYAGVTWAWRWKSGPNRAYHLRPENEWIRLPDATTPAIVSREAWDTARRRLATNAGEMARNRSHLRLLRGLAFCARCQRRLWVDANLHNPRKQYYYCPSRVLDPEPCGAAYVNALDVEAWAWDEVRIRLNNPALIAQELHERAIRSAAPSSAAELRDLRKRLDRLARGQERLLARYAETEAIPWSLVETEIQRAETEKADVQSRIAALDRGRLERQRTQRQTADLSDWCRRAAGNLAMMTFDEQRKTLSILGVRVLAAGDEFHLTTDPAVF